MTQAEPRDLCFRCDKPRVVCVCARVPRVLHRTPITVLQHPKERAHPIGTARLVRLGLANARVEVAWNANEVETLAPPWLAPGTGVLYPGANARDLASTPPGERPRALIVIDGTWHTARTLHRDRKWLHELPHFRLAPESPSRYRIRREPSRHAVSTLEAILEALRVLEPDLSGADRLLAAFDGMIDDQLGYMGRSAGRTRKKERRPRGSRRLPRAVVEQFGELVVAYGESARPDPRGPRELVQWAAVRLADGATFERFLRPTFGLPGARHLEHMELREGDFADAIPAAQFQKEWTAFASRFPGALVAAWNQTTLDLLGAALGTEPSRAALKGAYRSSHALHSGSLEEVADRERFPTEAFGFRGRAARRLGAAVAVARALHGRALF